MMSNLLKLEQPRPKSPKPISFVLSAWEKNSMNIDSAMNPLFEELTNLPFPNENLRSFGCEQKIIETSALNTSLNPAQNRTPYSTSAPAVAHPTMALSRALEQRRECPLHPFNLKLWALLFNKHKLDQHYHILNSFQHGFSVGIPSLRVTFTPNNARSIFTHFQHFRDIIQNEVHCGRLFGPFSQYQLESLLGPFQSSPLSLVPKNEPNQFRLVQNLSFPLKSSKLPPNINSYINSELYPSYYGTFLIVALTIRSLPPGSQAMTRDVKDAYRTVPLHPSQWAGTILRHPNPDAFYVNTANCFGLSSAGGIWGQVADVLCDLFRASGYGPVSKWVDDFLFFRIPTKSLVSYNAYRANIRSQLTPHQTHSHLFFQGSTLPDGSNFEYDDFFTFPLRNIAGSHYYAYSATQLDAFSAALGIPWKHSKSTSFASTVTYLGFNWHLDSYSIELAPSKHSKYRLALTHFRASTFHSLLDLQQIYSKLLHITLIVPRARVYLASFEAMLALNQTTPSQRRWSSKRMLIDLDWWGDFLAQPRLLFPLPNFSPYLPLAAYSDASSGFGIGLSYNGHWAAFSYQRHFKPGSHDIAWAEALVAYSFDGSRIVSGSNDTTIRVWNAESGEIVGKPITGHKYWVNSVCFSPDGKRILSGNSDNTARVWDAVTGKLLFPPFSGHTNYINSVRFFPDGTRFATGSRDGTIRIWTLDEIPDETNWELRDNGWFIGENGELMIWIPRDLRNHVYGHRNICMLNRSFYIKLNFGTEQNISRNIQV
ncbi:reverse transcriptase ribonuclease H [Pyrrhoderma noxium]|uniref:Reverse transcriptase ribonuclease H n=1 Tax=Pyrrhoderma noxium TaxID=2282107 RepID=A0A286U557_9AGAM|nr:reverse transcriptase ribonuclease H [Pyrrhoderma noxium]